MVTFDFYYVLDCDLILLLLVFLLCSTFYYYFFESVKSAV